MISVRHGCVTGSDVSLLMPASVHWDLLSVWSVREMSGVMVCGRNLVDLTRETFNFLSVLYTGGRVFKCSFCDSFLCEDDQFEHQASQPDGVRRPQMSADSLSLSLSLSLTHPLTPLQVPHAIDTVNSPA